MAVRAINEGLDKLQSYYFLLSGCQHWWKKKRLPGVWTVAGKLQDDQA